ncbi:MAG: hypothetical protein ACFFDW_01215 [Candidatus Thorarchaeota archaeon]
MDERKKQGTRGQQQEEKKAVKSVGNKERKKEKQQKKAIKRVSNTIKKKEKKKGERLLKALVNNQL